MVQGHFLRSHTRKKMLIAEAITTEEIRTDESVDYIPPIKSRRITDYFQPVETPTIDDVETIVEICTPSKGNFLPQPLDLSSKTLDVTNGESEQAIKEDNCPVSVITEDECVAKDSPATPHRITLCTDSLDLKSEAKPEIKSFQKPLSPTKGRKRLVNRFNVVEEPSKPGINRKLTLNNFLPLRKSVRKTKTTVLEEKQRLLEKILRNNIEEGLKITYFEEKGRGVVADKEFKRGDFVVEYSGDLIEISEAKKREEIYAADKNTGCYMYYFVHNNHKYCIDATAESERFGRLVNHSRNGNLMTKTVPVDGKPRLVLIAKEDITIGQELLYDYGDRSKESLKNHPWLAY